eukprot:364665-Chlamydomonas_euryale.AAC.5
MSRTPTGALWAQRGRATGRVMGARHGRAHSDFGGAGEKACATALPAEDRFAACTHAWGVG